MNKVVLFFCFLIITLDINIRSNDRDSYHALNIQPNVIIGYKIPEIEDTKFQIKGLYCEKSETIGIRHLNDTIAIIEVGTPSIVAIADKAYPWGWFQFPLLGVNDEGHILVKWSMKNDIIDDYGKPNGDNNCRISFDGGKSWNIPSKNQIFSIYNEAVNLPNGDFLALYTLPTEDISSLSEFSLPIFSERETEFFWESALPTKFKGIYETYSHNNSKRIIHADVNNKGLIRAITDKKLSTFWFGKLLMKDGDIYACVYPTYYLDNNGTPSPIAVTCYKSSDLGKTWNFQGKIDYRANVNYKADIGLNKKGFTEPTFEFLKDDKIFCVMRTSAGQISPMYKTYSSDYGVTWSNPVPITPNGVMPQLIKLDQDILVLASGRPGIQLRFSFDGNGDFWSDPIELIDYEENKNWVYDTCGYPFLYKASENEVYIVYSDFKKNVGGKNRKSIIFRKIKAYRVKVS